MEQLVVVDERVEGGVVSSSPHDEDAVHADGQAGQHLAHQELHGGWREVLDADASHVVDQYDAVSLGLDVLLGAGGEGRVPRGKR